MNERDGAYEHDAKIVGGGGDDSDPALEHRDTVDRAAGDRNEVDARRGEAEEKRKATDRPTRIDTEE